MSSVEVFWLSRHPSIDAHGPWDTRILDALFAGEFGRIGVTFTHVESSHVNPGGPAVVVLPARHHVKPDDVVWLNTELAKRSAVLLILCGDEEGRFPWQQVDHGLLYWWVQMPTPQVYSDLQGAFWFGNGAPHGATPSPERHTGWFFAGQGTNGRRKEAVVGLNRAAGRGVGGVLHVTEGFAQGLPTDEYLAGMGQATFAVCPSGPKHQDTFRAYEALESVCVTLVDGRTPAGDSGYWRFVYGDHPLIEVDDWAAVGGLIEETVDPERVAAVQSAWWTRQKRGMAARMEHDLTRLGVEVEPPDGPTILVTTSPAPSNPDLAMITETVETALVWWPDADVVVACDGVRPEQEHMRPQYSRFLRDLVAMAQTSPNMTVFIADRWLHQASLVRETLQQVPTGDVLLVMEHDTPLVCDEPSDPAHCFQMVADGMIEVLRFHHEASVLADHEHLMIDPSPVDLGGVPVRRTKQWSQRPHLARRDYYMRILTKHFSVDARCFIEDRMYGIVLHAPRGRHRVAIYHPAGGNIKRSYHLDGRAGGPKFDDIQVW